MQLRLLIGCALLLLVMPAAGEPPPSRKKSIRSSSGFERKAQRRPRCRDGKDNDRDGLFDYPEDPGCRSRRDRREKDPVRMRPTPIATPYHKDLRPGVSLGGRRPFPDDNPWNTDISRLPVDPNSDIYIASIGADTGLHPDFGTLWQGEPNGVPYTVVGADQPRVPVDFYYHRESDSGPYPIPPGAPIQGGPNSTGDRHLIVIDRDNWVLYELFDAHFVGPGWRAGSGAIFDLSSNRLRPAGWTSADAAGLPIFPGLVRYDEVYEQGEIRHALRFTASRTRLAYVYPARHYASYSSDPRLPPMGMRVRLKSSYDISTFPYSVRIVLQALKRYGMFLADNGADWFISGAPDPRWNDLELAAIRRVKGRDFEVVQLNHIVE